MKVIIAPSAGVSCTDPPSPPTIDVVALSVGRPDGAYIAGKRLGEWLTFDERVKLWGSPCTREEHEARRDLSARRDRESLVVRWTIEGGRAGAPQELRMRDCTGMVVQDKLVPYTWGAGANHMSYAFGLVNDTIRRVVEACQRPRPDTGDDTYKAVERELFAGLHDLPDEWVVAEADVLRVVRRVELERAWAKLRRIEQAARAAGVDVEAARQAATEGEAR